MPENTATTNAKKDLANEIKGKIKELNALIKQGKELGLKTFVVQDHFSDNREVFAHISETKEY